LTQFLTALGDPLIKGLTEVANQRPDDPIAFLANYLQNFSKGESSGRLATTTKTATVDENKSTKDLSNPEQKPLKEFQESKETAKSTVVNMIKNVDVIEEAPQSPETPEKQSNEERVKLCYFLQFF
jgi:hypothetical protein